MRPIRWPKGSVGLKAFKCIKIFFFFNVVCLGWLIFRAESVGQIGVMLKHLFRDFFMCPGSGFFTSVVKLVALVFPLLIIQSLQYVKDDMLALMKLGRFPKALIYCIILWLIMMVGVTGGMEFVYFQF